MLSSNPTKTRTIEKNWNRELNKRWREFKLNTINELERISRSDNLEGFQLNRAEPFDFSASQQRTYMAYLQGEIDKLLIGTDESTNWQKRYQEQAYLRGIESTRKALLAQGADIVPTAEEALAAQNITVFTATPSLGAAINSQPIHRDALQFLYTRSYTSLRGWTDVMAKETRQILFDGVAQGKGITAIISEMVERQDVSRNRARVIARTETIQAYQQSTTNEAERSAEEIGEEILLRWLTVKDSNVRHLHREWHGTLATPKENRRRIGVSPWMCRCGQSPVITEANTKKKQNKFDIERNKLLAMGKI